MKPEHWCDREMVRCPLRYGLATTEKSYHEELRRLKVPEKDWSPFISTTHSHATTHIFDSPKHGVAIIVCIRPGPGRTGIEIAGLLVHEAVHIWQEACSNIGEREPSPEFEAYSIQAIAQGLLWQYRDQVIRRRRR